MTTLPALTALALPRAVAFASGLLVPVDPHTRRAHGIPFPVRFTAAAWLALVSFPGPRGRPATPEQLDVRLCRVLQPLSAALTDCRPFLLSNRAIFLALGAVSITVLASEDEEGTDILTLALTHETR